MERLTKNRTIAVLLFFTLILGMFSMQLYGKQIRDADPHARSGNTNATLTRVQAARGDILDRNGNILVTNRASFDLVFNNYVFLNAENPNEALRQLIAKCEEMGLEYNETFPVTMEKPYEYTLDEYSSARQGYFRDFLFYHEWDADISAAHLIRKMRDAYRIPEDWTDQEVRKVIGLRYEIALRSDITNLPPYVFITDIEADNLSRVLETNTPGLTVESSTVREYTTSHAAHILGTVGKMTPEQYDYYKTLDYPMDASVGQSGFELAFEEYLHGSDGWKRTVVDSKGNILSESYEVEPKAGNNVETTIDLELQIAAENALEEIILYLRENGINQAGAGKDAEGGAVVVMDVKTGEVLACASYPTYNPMTYHEDFDKLMKEDFAPMYNRALLATYAPGSIFKMTVAIAGMETGTITPYTEITDKGIYRKYKDSGFTPTCLVYSNVGATHGTIDVMEAIEYSCNYFFYEVGDQMGIAPIDETAKGLGLGELTGIELEEAKGHRANPEIKMELYGDNHGEWYKADTITASIGQSEARFTPMQMCTYAVSLANQGAHYRATFLNRVVSDDYRTLIVQNEPEILNTVPVSDTTYQAYKKGMNMAAQSPGGTAFATFNDYPMKVCVKTGTATHGSGGSANASFICFAPMDNPEIAIAVFVEKGAHGDKLAPVARTILEAYFGKTASGEEFYPQEGGLS